MRFLNAFIMRAVFLCFMILVFNEFWSILQGAKNTVIPISPVAFLSYLMIGAILQFSKPEGVHKQIEDDLRTGNLAYHLLRPLNLVLYYFCQIIGVYIIRVPILFCIGTAMIFIATGSFIPIEPIYLPIVIALLFLSACFAALCLVFIGLSTLYLYDSLPLFWLVQKCEYVLGGLFFPIIFYPQWLYKICLLTPFGWGGYGVAHLLYDFSAKEAFNVFIHLAGWNLVIMFALFALFKLIKRKISIYG